MQLKPKIKSITAFAPATCANVAVGFDLLGFALGMVGDEVTLKRHNKPEITIAKINSLQPLTTDPDKNVASAVVKRFCEDHQIESGFEISINKGIPLSSGLGGSAASAVAALVALNHFLMHPVSVHELASYALYGEYVATGAKHADNVVPCLFGGLTLTRSTEPLDVLQLPIPDIFCVMVHPQLQLDTREARRILPTTMALKTYLKQSANLASFIVALYQNNIELMRKCLQDVLIEPFRSPLVQGFDAVKQAALNAGAIGVSLSGSGPSLFAFAENETDAHDIKKAMSAAFKTANVNADSWISKIQQKAAFVKQSLENN